MFSTPRRRRIGWAILYGCAALFLLLVVATILSTRQLAAQVRSTQLEGTPTGKKLVASADRILDCTDPGDPDTGRPPGKCFTDGQKRTANAVGDINRVIVLAAACSVGLNPQWSVPRRQAEIQACVIDRLAQRAQKP